MHRLVFVQHICFTIRQSPYRINHATLRKGCRILKVGLRTLEPQTEYALPVLSIWAPQSSTTLFSQTVKILLQNDLLGIWTISMCHKRGIFELGDTIIRRISAI